MEDFGVVEADFQQYYRLDLEAICRTGTGFLRYARLFNNLPPDSRTYRKWSPGAEWSWGDETQSRILYELSQIKALLYNTNRKKGQKPLEPDKLFQPKHVLEVKEKYAELDKQKRTKDQEDIESFWKRRNAQIQES